MLELNYGVHQVVPRALNFAAGEFLMKDISVLIVSRGSGNSRLAKQTESMSTGCIQLQNFISLFRTIVHYLTQSLSTV